MKAARYYGNRDIRIEDIPEPKVEPGTVGIDVAYCGICGTDLHEYLDGPIFCPAAGHPHPISGEAAPITLGHEMSGVVYEVGEGVTGLEVGDHVVVEPYIVADDVDTGPESLDYHLSKDMNFIGLAGRGGGLAEKIVVDGTFDPREVDVAEEVRKVTGGKGADVAFEATSVQVVLDTLMDALRPTGVLVMVSIWGHKSEFDMHKLVMKEIDMRGTIAYVNNHPDTIKLVEEGKVNLKPFITGKIAIDDLVDKGFDTLINHNETAVKILVSKDGK